ncbi:hypothetical protein [Nonomuraea longicatena]
MRKLVSVVSMLLTMAFVLATAPTANAAQVPARGDGQRPTLLVHGFDREADTNCAGSWRTVKDTLLANGWSEVRTFGYYNRSTNCDLGFAGTTDTRVQEVGRRLAWTVYDAYSVHGVAVDIMGHSLGGLVAKAAIEGVNRYGGNGTGDWPPHLYVEDIVTFSTPHKGITGWVEVCALTHEQCSDMRQGSGFLSWLGKEPDSQMGTDYTFLGSDSDTTVRPDSATNGRRADHWSWYYKNRTGGSMDHTAIRNTATGSWDTLSGDHSATRTRAWGDAPVLRGMQALFSHQLA